MNLLIITGDSQFTIAEPSAGDMVWIAMNQRSLTPEKVRAEFPDAPEKIVTIQGQKITGVLIDEP